MSSAVMTVTTPGTASAAAVSTDTSRAWWRAERCILRCSSPLGRTSSKNSVRPVTWPSESALRTTEPTTEKAGSAARLACNSRSIGVCASITRQPAAFWLMSQVENCVSTSS